MRDCWRRCLAHLMTMPWELVPDFVNDDPEYWLSETNEWLKDRGKQLLVLVSIDGSQNVQVTDYVSTSRAHVQVGMTAAGVHHAVVCGEDGTIWDPLPAGGELLTITAMYWVVDG